MTGSHDATTSGLPSLAQLTPREQAIVRSTATADIAMRTAAATLLAATFVPAVTSRSSLRREIANADFYASFASRHDPAASFPRPTHRPAVRSRRAGPAMRRLTVADAEILQFTSGFTPINPELRKLWRTFERNDVVHAQHWRHLDGPRPTLIVIHGFFASTYLFNSVFFQLPWFYRAGFDVVLFTLPFHGPRAEQRSPYSGYGYFAHGTSGFVESSGQAIHDLRLLIDHLESTGVSKVGVTGISLGGYTSALLASVDDRLQLAVPNVPVIEVPALLDSWFPASTLLRFGLKAGGTSTDTLADVLAYSSPLNYSPAIPRERRLIITGLGDRLAPPEQAAALWEHWDRCALHWFPGNHLMHISQPDYLRRMTRFMKDADFMPDNWRSRAG
ncbi:MAG: alpha/beta hydrolase family protein [Nocardiaceae bacterium]|nr:alpha/beta hydrolase family protein [Nocardiaceae bacterium]